MTTLILALAIHRAQRHYLLACLGAELLPTRRDWFVLQRYTELRALRLVLDDVKREVRA